MTTDLEEAIRATLAGRAAGVPADAVARVTGAGYRPRTARVSRRLTLGGLAGAATTGTVAAVVVLGGSQAAFAGWTAAPSSAVSPGQLSSAVNSCDDSLSSMPPPVGAGGGSAGWTTVVTDVRGPFTVLVLHDGDRYASCFNGPDFTVVSSSGDGTSTFGVASGSSSGGGQGQSSVSILTGSAGGGVPSLQVAHLISSGNGPYTLVEGRADVGVTGVTLVRSDGTDVVATVADGWVLAWWPGTQGVTAADVATAGGTATETLGSPVGPPPVGSCPSTGSGGPTVCAGGGQGGPPAPSTGGA